MKPRRWVLVLAVAVLAGVLLIRQGIRLLESDKRVERILAQRMSPLVGGSFDVQRVRLGFLCVYLQDVHLTLPMRGLRIEVSDIRIGFSLWKLARFRGDIGRSINGISLLDPKLDITLYSSYPASAPARPDKSFDVAVFQRLPVEYLTIRRGVVRLIDRAGHPFEFGNNLSGRIGAVPTGLAFEFRGCVASRSKNLSIAGSVARTGGRHRLSVRLNRAKVNRPLDLGVATITGGTLDGVCEFELGDTLLPSAVSANGTVTIDAGTCSVRGLNDPVEDVRLRMRLDNTLWVVDTLAGRWKNMLLAGSGVFDASDRDMSSCEISFSGSELREIAPQAPELVLDNIIGAPWVNCSLRKVPRAGAWLARISAGGVTAFGSPITRCVASLSLASGSATLDSMIVEGLGFRSSASGSVNYSKTPAAYAIRAEGAIDTCPAVPQLTGALRFRGELHGLGDQPRLRAELGGVDLVYASTPLGSPTVSVKADRHHIQAACEPGTGAYVSGSAEIDSAFSAAPWITATISLGARSLAPLVSVLPDSVRSSVNDLRADVSFSGTPTTYDVAARLRTSGTLVKGQAVIRCASAAVKGGGLRWEALDDGLTLHDSAVGFSAHGRWWPDSISVDSVRTLGTVTGRGHVGFAGKGSLEFSLSAIDAPVQSLSRWLLGEKMPVELTGLVSGNARLTGSLTTPRVNAEAHARSVYLGSVGPLATDAVFTAHDGALAVRPMVLRKGNRALITLDTLAMDSSAFVVAGAFDGVDLGDIFREELPDDWHLAGPVTGRYSSSAGGFPVTVHARSPRMSLNRWAIDSVSVVAEIGATGMRLRDLRCADSSRSRLRAEGDFPYSFFANDMHDEDTVHVSLNVNGDLLATLGRNFDSPVGGTGRGELKVSLVGSSEGWRCLEGNMVVEKGTLLVKPFVASRVDNFSFRMTVRDSQLVDTEMRGMIGRKRMVVVSRHSLPAGYEGLKIGPVDLGALQVSTPDRGVELHLPGFMPIGEVGVIEFAGAKPFDAFTISGPVDRLRITGTWILQDVEFTFPFINEPLPWDFDPFPFVTWELDLKAGRDAVYFWELRGKRAKLVRFFEGNVDRSSWVSVRGREGDKTFQLLGSLRSYKGAAFFGKVFDRNVKVGLDFAPQRIGQKSGYDNLPIIWGSAEAFSDSSRYDRVTLTLQLQDPATGGISEKGRIALIPATPSKDKRKSDVRDSIPNFVFRLSSDFEEIPGESEREFYREAGLRFTSLEGATEFVSDFGEQYLHRYFLQRAERRLAKALGLDVITFETSIASNYFNSLYGHRYGSLFSEWNLLANMGITVGRYFLNDAVFLKARGEFVPTDTTVRPEYSFGLEIQPAQYFMMDVSNAFYVDNQTFQYNPRVQMQLRMPITRLRKAMKF